MGAMERYRRLGSATAVPLLFLSKLIPGSSFFSAPVSTAAPLWHARLLSCSGTASFCPAFRQGHDQRRQASGLRGTSSKRCRSPTRGYLAMERPSGQFNRLAKPAFDRDNPNAVLGEVDVPGLEQVCMAAQAQMFPKRETVQLLKERLQEWCAEENRRELEGVRLPGGASTGDRKPRKWRAYEFIALPSRNRTLDSEVLGMNVGRPVNDTRLEVVVDFEKESEAKEVGMRLLGMMADVSKEANEVFGYVDNAASGGDQLGPWSKSGAVNSWRKWLELKSGEGEPLPEAAVTVFRVVQANWAVPKKIAAAMNFTAAWSTAQMEESKADPTTPLREIEVLHSAIHPHVIKIAETFASSEAMLAYFHRNYQSYLSGVFDFRAAVNPTVQAYTPLEASLRPCLSATLTGGAMVPLVAIGGVEDGVAPRTGVVLEGLKLGLRHVVLNASSSGVEETVEALTAALAFGVVKRHDLFVTMMVGERNSTVAGGAGMAATVRETLANGRVEDGGSEEDGSETRLLDSVDALVLSRESGEYFDDDQKFLEMWEETRQAATCPARKSSRPPVVPTKETDLDKPGDDDPFASPFSGEDGADDFDDTAGISYDNVVNISPVDSGGSFNKPFFVPDDDGPDDDSDDRPEQLARHVGVGGHGPLAADRLALLARMASSSSETAPGAGTAPDMGNVPGILPRLFFGDLRAGDGASTSETAELCHDRGVQAFSLRYEGGQGGVEAGKGAAAAADFEYEDVTGDEVLAKWILDIGGGVVWRPRQMEEVWRTLPLARYYLPPEWITEIVDRGGCPPEAWARTLSRLCPIEGTPSEDEIGSEVEETVAGLMDAGGAQPGESGGANGQGGAGDDDDYDGLWMDE
ncbi:unnamed protein product [Scytosiphon promiscuus]